MARQKPVDEEGKPIDPNTQLEKFLQKAAPISEESAPPPEPAYKTVTFDDVDDPDLKGKTGQDALQLLADRKKTIDAERQRADTAEIELARARQQQQIDAAARQAVEALNRPAPAPPPPPQIDPREAQIDEMWFTDPSAARKLLSEMQADQRKREREEERTATKQEVFSEMTTAQRKARADWAYNVATTQLQAEGVPAGAFNVDRMTAVYSAITRPPTADAPNPYWTNGGPTNPQVIYQAYRDFFGVPTPAPEVPPQQQAAAPPAPPAPPGSSKPAPAATTPRAPQTHLSQQDKREIDHLGKAFNLDPEKLAARRRARMERDAHA